jgi:hypothetical protein
MDIFVTESALDIEMKSESTCKSSGRYIMAYIVMVVMQALLYSAASFGTTVKPVLFFLVGISSLLISLLIELPVALLGIRFRYRRGFLALFVFALLFFVFFVLNVMAMADSIELIVQSNSLVVDGKVTGSGYWVAMRDSVITAFIGTLSFVVFMAIAPLYPTSKSIGRSLSS